MGGPLLFQRYTGRSVSSSHQGSDCCEMDCAAGTTKNGSRDDSCTMSLTGSHRKNDRCHEGQYRHRRSKLNWSCRRCYTCLCTTLVLFWCIFFTVLQEAHIESNYPVDDIFQHLNISESGAKPINKKVNLTWPTWEEIVQEKTLAALSLNMTFPLPDAPMHLVRLNYYTTDRSNINNDLSLPLVAIVTSTRSTTRATTTRQTMLWKYLIKSMLETITKEDRKQFRVHLFVAVDDIDLWWLQHCRELEQSGQLQWLPVTLGVYAKRGHHIPFNEMAYTAYQENATYFCRVNDDTQFLSKNWVTLAVKTLQSYDPPNIGVTGPLCEQGNTNILTHDFVHRHHMEIFGGQYYPPAFNNWYLDDWISFVYSSKVLGPHFHRFSVLSDWKVKHWLSVRRYDTNVVDAQWLPIEYERGRRLIASYLQEHFSDRGSYTIGPSLPSPALLDTDTVDAILEVLPSAGNLLIWGLDMDSHFWHRATTGRVAFLNDHQIPENMEVTASQPYLEVHNVRHHLKRGPEAQRETHQQFMNETTAMNWCDWEMSQFPESVRQTVWDVVLVAAPVVPVVGSLEGMDDIGPGVFQSLYMTQRLVRASLFRSDSKKQQSHIFVQHYQRAYERDLTGQLFPETPPVEVIVQNQTATSEPIQEIAHFVLEASKITSPPPYCEPPPIRVETLFWPIQSVLNFIYC